jgi:hypothetical protein
VHYRYQQHRWKILPPVSLVLLILVGKFAAVVNNRKQIATGIKDTNDKFVSMTLWQIMGTLLLTL